MRALERRYRAVLRLLPRWYRERREQEMVGVFLADASDYDLRFGWPGWSECASVAALGVRTRLGGADAPARSFVWGETVRRVALLGLLAQAAMTLMGLATLE